MNVHSVHRDSVMNKISFYKLPTIIISEGKKGETKCYNKKDCLHKDMMFFITSFYTN